MIYFFNNDLGLEKVVTSSNILIGNHEHELNNLIRADVVLDLEYALSFIDDVDFFGYYYKDVFYLHKITRQESEHEAEVMVLAGRHIFFEDMLYSEVIKDIRPQNRDAKYMLDQAIGGHTRWNVVMIDSTGTLSTNFYWQMPYEALEWIVEHFRLEYLPVILFDGQKINGYELHVKKRLGENKGIRIPWGERVEKLNYEIDFSDIVTQLAPRGKGEEIGEGIYSRRINISDVNFSRDGVVSPVGNLYLEDKSLTAKYGNDGGKPRKGEGEFYDIDDVNELAEAGYQMYLDVSRPQVVISADVVDIGDVTIGDGVNIIRREHDLYFEARVHKISVDLLNPDDAQIELGDYEHFKESKVQKSNKRRIQTIEKEVHGRIYRLEIKFNENFDGVVNQWREEYEQAFIDAYAEIQAAEQRMETLINTTRNDWTDTFNAEVDEIYRKANEDYNRIETEITGVIDSTREEMEMDFNDSVQNTREYAEQQAQEKATAVRTDLETVTSGHQSMLDSLHDNVMNIDDFIGDKTVGLNELLYNERMLFEEKLNNVDTWHYNMLRGTRFDEGFWNGHGMQLETDTDTNQYVFTPSQTGVQQPHIQTVQEVSFDEGVTYKLSFDWQTYAVRAVDYIWIMASEDSETTANLSIWHPNNHDDGTHLYTSFGTEFRRVWLEFTPNRNISGFIRIGANLDNNELGRRVFKISLPYLTTTENTRWLYHQQDSSQNIEEITRRVNQLEDGREEFITKTQFDFETGEIEGTIRNILETVDGRESIIQNHEDWINTNGASVIESAEGFQSKAWLSDIHNPNMISHSRFVNAENIDFWGNWSAPLLTKYGDEWIRVRNMNAGNNLGAISPKIPDKITEGETYTITWEAFFNLSESRISSIFDYMYVMYSEESNRGIGTPKIIGTKNEMVEGVSRTIYQYELTFTAHHTDDNAAILFGTTCQSGQDNWFFMRQPKLELGNRATPYYNAYSMFNQRADEMQLAVQDTISQSDIHIRPEYVQIGSQSIDGDTVGSLLRVSPDGIDAVAEGMRLSGDLFVAGDIEALAISAIEGEFASLWADEFSAITIDADDIQGLTAEFERMYTLNANIERLVSQHVFSDGVTALVGNFVDVNAGNIVTSGLSANVILSSHINSSNALINKLFSNSARIDTLITKDHFVDNIKALTIEAIYADLRSVNSEIMDTNILKADWIQGGNALLDKVFANTAMFERMMAKSGFVRTLNTVTIDTDQLTIRRPDGGVLVSNGTQRFGSPIITKAFPGEGVEFDGANYVTPYRSRRTFERAYSEHSGRWANFSFRIALRWDSAHTSAMVGINIRPQTLPSGVSVPNTFESFRAYRDSGGRSVSINVRLPVPTFGAMSWVFEFYIDHNVSGQDYPQIRSERCWTSA